jgi:hypothetical protein
VTLPNGSPGNYGMKRLAGIDPPSSLKEKLMSSVGNFALTKTCESNRLCTVESSNLEAIPAGTHITYTYNGDGSDGLAYPTITVEGGTASGVCDWKQPSGGVLAKCTFGKGTGSLARFNLEVDVTVVGDPNDPASVWHWDGTYSFGNGD